MGYMDAEINSAGHGVGKPVISPAIQSGIQAAARTMDEVWAIVAKAIKQFQPKEPINYFAAAGYDQD